LNHRRGGHGGPGLPGLSPTREVPDDRHNPSAALVLAEPVFTNTERLAQAGSS